MSQQQLVEVEYQQLQVKQIINIASIIISVYESAINLHVQSALLEESS